MADRVAKTARIENSTRVWGIYVAMPGVLPLQTLRTTRRGCIKEYTAFYGAKTKPRITWAQLYRWGWRCIPVSVSFNSPR